MKYVTNLERRGRQEGRQEGQLHNQPEAVVAVLETRFGDVPYPLREAVTDMDNLARLRQWHRLAIQLPSLEAFQTQLHERGNPGV